MLAERRCQVAFQDIRRRRTVKGLFAWGASGASTDGRPLGVVVVHGDQSFSLEGSSVPTKVGARFHVWTKQAGLGVESRCSSCFLAARARAGLA